MDKKTDKNKKSAATALVMWTLVPIIMVAGIIVLFWLNSPGSAYPEAPVSTIENTEPVNIRYCAPNEKITDCVCLAKNINNICMDYGS